MAESSVAADDASEGKRPLCEQLFADRDEVVLFLKPLKEGRYEVEGWRRTSATERRVLVIWIPSFPHYTACSTKLHTLKCWRRLFLVLVNVSTIWKAPALLNIVLWRNKCRLFLKKTKKNCSIRRDSWQTVERSGRTWQNRANFKPLHGQIWFTYAGHQVSVLFSSHCAGVPPNAWCYLHLYTLCSS